MANVCRNKSSATIQHNRRDSQVPSSGPLCCPLCPAIFTSRSHFLCHVGSTHPGSFFAACKTCGQSFAPHEITAHVATCKGAHVCVHCRQTFALLSYLKRHIRRRHSHEQEVTGVATAVVPRFVCKFCSKNFSSNNSLNNHIRGHLGACVCSICGTALVYERHNELVDCTACGNQMSFNSIGREVNYQATSQSNDPHEGCHGRSTQNRIQPPYSCPQCHRLYVSLTSFRRHLANHAADAVESPTRPPQLSPSPLTSISIGSGVDSGNSVLQPSTKDVPTSQPPRSNSDDQIINKTTPSSECLLPSEFCDIFSEEDWLQADSYQCLSASPNISLLHSILYEGASAELL